MTELTTTELSVRLGVTRRRALMLLENGQIDARRLANGAWLADGEGVARYERTAQRRSGRSLSVAASWGLLWELSGLDVDWLTASTHARVRRRIRDSTIEEIATSVAGRTTTHQFISANSERARAGLIATGRAASSELAGMGVDLMDDSRRFSGYVRSGTVDEYAASQFMMAHPDGTDVLFENTIPVTFDGAVMPSAVVAADLTRSLDTRERSAGLQALEELRNQWLDEH